MVSNQSFSDEVIQRFLTLYKKLPTSDAIAILEKEFPAVAKKRKPRKYWTQVAFRNGVKKLAEEEPVREDQMELPDVAPSTPAVEIPDHIVFGSAKIPLEALRYYRDQIVKDELSRVQIVANIRQRFPTLADAPESSLPNFFHLRFGAKTKADLADMSAEEFENQLMIQHRNQLVFDLHDQKWRDSAIAEKTAELFPELEPIHPTEIKPLVRIRRKTAKARSLRWQKRERKDDGDEEVRLKEPKVVGYSVKLTGPNMHYAADLTVEQAKNLLKNLLDL